MLSATAQNQKFATKVSLGLGNGSEFSLLEITPMGFLLSCSDDELNEIRGCVKPEDSRFQVIPSVINLQVRGDLVNLTSHVRIRSLRRTSQYIYEVSFSFQDMQQDGYRLIAEHLAERF